MEDLIRTTEKALGNGSYELTTKQKEGNVFSRSLYPICDISKGEIITNKNIKSVRPGYSLHPKFLSEIIGKRAKRLIPFGDRITLDDFE
jgi:pseudaminic acid synthase